MDDLASGLAAARDRRIRATERADIGTAFPDETCYTRV
jgi:hypothetical protein